MKSLVGTVRRGRQPEIDQRELRRRVELEQQALHPRARVGDVHVEVAAQDEVERVRDQRIVVDDQQIGLGLLGLLHRHRLWPSLEVPGPGSNGIVFIAAPASGRSAR
jgi:hypothetical protein